MELLLVVVACLMQSAKVIALVPPDSARSKIDAVRIEGEIELTGKLSDPRRSLVQPAQSHLSDFGSPFGLRQTARQYFLKLQYLLRS